MKSLTAIHLRRRKTLFAAFVVAASLSALMTMATALSVTDFLQLIFPSSEGGLNIGAGATKDLNPVMRLLDRLYLLLASMEIKRALFLYALLLLVLYGTKNLFSYLSAVSFARIKTGVLRDIRNDIHKSVLDQDFSKWSSQQQGQWLSRMSNDVAEYEANVLDSIQMIVSAVLTMLIYILMLLYLDWRLTALVVAVMAVGTLLLSAPRRLKRQSRQLQTLNGELVTTTQETIDSLKEIKAATAIDYVNGRQREQNRRFTRRRIGLYRRIYAASPISDFVGNVIVVAILIIGATHVLAVDSSMPAAMFVSYIMIYVLMLTPIKDFSNAIAQLKKGRGVEERMDFVSNRKDESHLSQAKPDEAIQSVDFKNVSFRYGNQNVIENLTFSLPMHCHTAIVGESGSGKTTLGRLLAGLLQPTEGEVLVNGAPTTADQRAGRIAYIPQEPMLFNDTIESNIRFGRGWLSRQDVEKAAQMAQLGPLLSSMPDGLDTMIGDGGGRLSGGERQRINIARALAGNPEVVVMDEATAALDAATEQRLTEEMHHSMENRTMVVIAHRASTIASCHGVFNIQTREFRKKMMLIGFLALSGTALADTIPLQAQQESTRVVALSWSGTTGESTLERRYPGESEWRTIATTASTSWTDRHGRAVCDDTVYYRVGNGADSGYAAVFVSDNDPTMPAEWGMVSVDMASQHIILSWEPSVDTDIMGYLICEGTPSIAIDTVFGRTNTEYAYMRDSCLDAHIFRICAFDSCRQASALTQSCNNIVLILNAPPCTGTATASWNHYQNMPSGVGGYEVWVSRDGGAYARVAQLDAQTSDYTLSVDDDVADMSLYVKAISADGRYVALSNVVTEHFSTADQPAYFYLRKVSVNGEEKDVCVVGQTDPDFPVSDYRVYRSSAGGAYSEVGHCSPDISGRLEWHDNSVLPANGVYSYCFGVTDACGRNEIRTQSGNTIRPRIDLSTNSAAAVIRWNRYRGWTGTTTYQIASAAQDGESWQSVGSTTDTTYTLEDSDGGLLTYRIMAFEGGDSEHRQFDSLQSVVVSHQPYTTFWMPNAFTPLESTNNTVSPKCSSKKPENYSFTIFNRKGLVVFSTTDIEESWDGTFQGRLQPMGAYVYKINYRQNDGSDHYTVGTIMLIY